MASSPWEVKFLVPKGSGKPTTDLEFCFSFFLCVYVHVQVGKEHLLRTVSVEIWRLK